MQRWGIFVLSAIAVVLAAVIIFMRPNQPALAPTSNTNQQTVTNTTKTSTMPATVTFSTADIPERDPAFSFTMRVPDNWNVDYLSGPKRISFFDPSSSGNTLAQSQIVVSLRQLNEPAVPEIFQAQQLLSVANTNMVINRYAVSLKPTVNVMPAPDLPTWLFAPHTLALLTGRASAAKRFVIEFAPGVDDAVAETILSSFTLQ